MNRYMTHGPRAGKTFSESMKDRTAKAKADEVTESLNEGLEDADKVNEGKGEDVVETVFKALDSLGMGDQRAALAHATDQSKDMEINGDKRAIYKLIAAMLKKF